MNGWKETRPEHLITNSSEWPDDGRFRFGITGDAAYGERAGWEEGRGRLAQYETEAAYVNAPASEVPDATTWSVHELVLALTPVEAAALQRDLAAYLLDVVRGSGGEMPEGFEGETLVEPYTWAVDEDDE